MMIRLDGLVDERDLEPFKYPPMRDLRELNIDQYVLEVYSMGCEKTSRYY